MSTHNEALFFKTARGLTMLESLVWVALFASVMLAITSALLAFYRTNSYAIQQGQAVVSAQRGVDSAVRTIRETSYSSQGAYPVVAIGAHSFTFYANTDSDAFIEKVRYAVDGTNLVIGTVDPSGDPPAYTAAEVTNTVADYVRNIERGTTTFHYYNSAGTEITDYARVGDVRFVTIDLIINIDVNRLPNELTLHSSATLRNIVQQ